MDLSVGLSRLVVGRNGDGIAAAVHSRLDHALRNLLDNAIRHGAAPASVDILTTDQDVSVFVTDAGGRPATTSGHVFARDDEQSDSKPGNIGLGLPTARLLVEAMGTASTSSIAVSFFACRRRPRRDQTEPAPPADERTPRGEAEAASQLPGGWLRKRTRLRRTIRLTVDQSLMVR